jgi:predicted transcriptional regulator
MKLKKVEILVMSDKEYEKHLDTAFKEAEKGKTQSRKIVLNSVSDLSGILTKERIKLLKTIKEKKPASITGLAKEVGRDRRNVVSDLRYLEGFGLVEVEAKKKKKGAKELQVVYNEITVHIPV